MKKFKIYTINTSKCQKIKKKINKYLHITLSTYLAYNFQYSTAMLPNNGIAVNVH